MAVTTETATVFRGGDRRWFSRKAAVKAEAALLFRTHFAGQCDCDDDDPIVGYSGNTCHLHAGNFRERFTRRVARLIEGTTP